MDEKSTESSPIEVMNAEELNALYRPFPTFALWAKLEINQAGWDAIEAIVASGVGVAANVLQRARKVATRAAAIDTGALEDLYDVNTGFTISVATEVGAWEAAFGAETNRRDLIESQLEAYEYVLDFATKKTPFAETWIRELHSILCKNQSFHAVNTAAGVQHQALPLGVYKSTPNHVKSRSGKYHSYAPPSEVSSEMARLVGELSSADFLSAHPVIQSAYAHYAFVAIHPFSDGNGRVARALASVFLYRAASIPLMVLMEHRDAYFAALERSDSHDYQALVSFVQDRSLDAANLVAESVRTAKLPDAETTVASISRLYVTRGGYEHAVIDGAGGTVIDYLANAIPQRIKTVFTPISVVLNVQKHAPSKPPPSNRYRQPINPNVGTVVISVSVPAPATATARIDLYLWVPFDPVETDPVVIGSSLSDDMFEVPLNQIVPRFTTVASLRISMFIEGIVGVVSENLRETGTAAMVQQGFLPKT